MANREQLRRLLESSRDDWNRWREQSPGGVLNLSRANLSRRDLSGWNLSGALLASSNLTASVLRQANLRAASFRKAVLSRTDLTGVDAAGADFENAVFSETVFDGANLGGALFPYKSRGTISFVGADLRSAVFYDADLTGDNFTRARLDGANLETSRLCGTNLAGATLDGASVYGVSVWDIQTDDRTSARGLIVSPGVTADDLEVAQLVNLLTQREKTRNVLATLGEKLVLLLGRFGDEQQRELLDELAREVHHAGYLPVIFDFERTRLDLIETIRVLAGLSAFVIADARNPKSVPHELGAIVPYYRIPTVLLGGDGTSTFATLSALVTYPWVREVRFSESPALVRSFRRKVLSWARRRAKVLSEEKHRTPAPIYCE